MNHKTNMISTTKCKRGKTFIKLKNASKNLVEHLSVTTDNGTRKLKPTATKLALLSDQNPKSVNSIQCHKDHSHNLYNLSETTFIHKFIKK
jgi:hypothetical protein